MGNIELSYDKTNILSVEDPDVVECDIEQMISGVAGQRIFLIRLSTLEHKPLGYCVLGGVFFFEGVVNWIGAEFNLASKQQVGDLADQFGWTENLPTAYREDLISDFFLVNIEAKHPQISMRFLLKWITYSPTRPNDFA